MKALPSHPSLYQINTRVWLTELSAALGRRATLDDIADAELDRLAAMGFDWIWLLSVWQTGPIARAISRSIPQLRAEFQQVLPDLREEDIDGSGFAIAGYTVHENLGSDLALARLRERLHARGLRLMLDFVANHVAPDHPWLDAHPDYFVQGSEEDLAHAPQNYCRRTTSAGATILAYGRDPYFPGWSDTLQLNYGNPALQQAMTAELEQVAGQCDGVRCDMAMLLLPEVFEKTWGIRSLPFWPQAIRRVREDFPTFTLLAEVYWDLEWTILQQGFDYAYDKRLYDRLHERHARSIREHLCAGLDYQGRLARFLENHDEPRAAASFPSGTHEAAAVVTYLSPGLRFFHQGQFEGRRKRISPHLVRAPQEPIDRTLRAFYARLIGILRRPAVRDGQWQLLECVPAWEGNRSCDAFIAWAWEGADEERLLVAVNYAPHRSQCYVRLPLSDLRDRQWRLRDLLGDAQYERDGQDLTMRGLYLDEPGWQALAFALTSRNE